MSSVFFELETLNPNSRTTYFRIKDYAEYLAKSEYAIRNKNTTHGLFGRVEQFPNIQDEEDLDGIKNFITNLAKNKKTIMRGVISLKEVSRLIIASSPQCQIEIEKYIQAKQKLLEFQYTDVAKLEEAKEKARQDAEREIIKMIGNQILDIERKWLNSREEDYTYTRYTNETRDLLDDILTALYYQAENRKKYNRNFELNFKKQLSKQAKKELANEKRNASEFEWDELNYD